MSKNLRYQQLKVELAIYNKAMSEAVDTILDTEVSKYPIMIAHQQILELGIPIVTTETFPQGNWNIYASSLEEFVAKQIITQERMQNFRATYKDPRSFLCIFTLSELGANFVFLPRNKKDPTKN